MRERMGTFIEWLLPLGVGEATRRFLEEWGILAIHIPNSVRARLRYRRASGLSIQLGCGPRKKQGWVNLDLKREADIRLDLRRSLPFSDGSASFVYSEHFLEHLDYPVRVGFLLDECRRILEPGGKISLVVPDIEVVLRAYVLGGSPEYYNAQKRWHPSWFQTHMEHINYNFRQDGEHQYAYDFETLTKLLTAHGFVNVRRRDFDAALDSPDRIVGSLYVEASRP